MHQLCSPYTRRYRKNVLTFHLKFSKRWITFPHKLYKYNLKNKLFLNKLRTSTNVCVPTIHLATTLMFPSCQLFAFLFFSVQTVSFLVATSRMFTSAGSHRYDSRTTDIDTRGAIVFARFRKITNITTITEVEPTISSPKTCPDHLKHRNEFACTTTLLWPEL